MPLRHHSQACSETAEEKGLHDISHRLAHPPHMTQIGYCRTNMGLKMLWSFTLAFALAVLATDAQGQPHQARPQLSTDDPFRLALHGWELFAAEEDPEFKALTFWARHGMGDVLSKCLELEGGKAGWLESASASAFTTLAEGAAFRTDEAIDFLSQAFADDLLGFCLKKCPLVRPFLGGAPHKSTSLNVPNR